MSLIFAGPGVTPTLRGQPANEIALNAGSVFNMPPGTWSVQVNPYHKVQTYDILTDQWRNMGDDSSAMRWVQSNGVTTRIANQTGCVVACLVNAGGTGYTSAPTVTASAGGAVLQAIVGGAVSTTVTVTNGGSGYTYPPLVQFNSPNLSAPGIAATGYCTLSSGAVSSVTVVDQGAGYTSAPTITFINDPREGLNGIAAGSGAAATCTLTGAGTITGVVVLDHGSALAAGAAVPTISFTGGGGSGATATAVMCQTILGYTVTSAGNSYATAAIEVTALGSGYPTSAPAYTNPTTNANIFRGRRASLLAALTGNTITGTGQVVLDGGLYAGNPAVNYTGQGGVLISSMQGVTAAAVLGLTMGGTSGVSLYNPA